MNRKKRSQQGFTLLELIVVITIIGILGTIVVVNVSGATDEAKSTRMRADCKAIYNAAVSYEAQMSEWPPDISALVNPKKVDENGNETLIIGCLREYPKDAWGNPDGYIYEGGGFEAPRISSYGKDKMPGGDGFAADYTYPEEEDFGG